MKIEKVHAVYFSPTGTTKTVITHLVKCITTLLPEVVTEVKDFTLPSGRKKVPDIRESELAIVGRYLLWFMGIGPMGMRSSNCMIF